MGRRWDFGGGCCRRRAYAGIRFLTIIVDAAPLVALGDRRDPQHATVTVLLKNAREPLVLPALVTAEIDYLVRLRGGVSARRAFMEDLSRGRFQVEGLTQTEHSLALDTHDRYSDLALGLADLSVIVLAFRHRTTRVLTFDERHFRAVKPLQGGIFEVLPADGLA